MTQDRLSGLSLTAIEKHLVSELKETDNFYDNVIDYFANSKIVDYHCYTKIFNYFNGYFLDVSLSEAISQPMRIYLVSELFFRFRHISSFTSTSIEKLRSPRYLNY
nr:unnamed protein product [Callosobruchus analis]